MKAYHTGIFGDSGGGKTTLARELFHDPGWECRSVWVNHNSESGLTGHGGRDAEIAESETALRQSTSASVNYRVSNQEQGVETAVRFAADYYEQRGVPVQVFVDECHDVWPAKGDGAEDNALKWALHEGRDKGVVVRFMTQDPQDLKPYTPLKQARYIAWCGPWNKFHEGFLRYYGLDKAILPEREYQYVVLDKQGTVIFEGETNEKYS